MTTIEFLTRLTEEAKSYRKDCKESVVRNSHMNEVGPNEIAKLPDEAVDAILVDYINRIGYNMGIDYALYTRDLDEDTD